jgi:hypothetical protein
MDDAVFDELMDQTFDTPTAEDSGRPTGKVQDAEAAGWVTEDHREAPDSTESVAPAEQVEAAPAQSEEPAPQFDVNQLWNSDANPYKVQAQQAQAQAQAAAKFLEDMRVKQAMAQLDQQLQQRIDALPDMEPEQLTKEVHRLIAERESVREMLVQAKAAEQQQQAEQVAKVQVINILSQRHGLTQQEVQMMQQMNDPNQMEQFAMTAMNIRQQAMSEVEQLRQQLAQYQLNQQAQARRGVDRVGSQAVAPASPSTPAPKNFDEFWASFVGEG